MKEVTGWQLPHDVLEYYRFRAIALWKEGKKVSDIAHFFGLHRVTVSYWIAAYKRGGKHALRSRKAPGPLFKLTQGDMKRIVSRLRQEATSCGFETPLWTTKRVAQIITKETKKQLDYSNVWRLLKRMGFTNQKPEKRAYEQDKKAVKKWLKEEWPKILAHKRRWQAVLYFQDEAGVSLRPVVSKTWAKKGKTPIVHVTGKKDFFCVSSAISTSGRMAFRIEKGKVVKETFVDFLQKLLDMHPRRKVIVVTDKARPHVAKFVDNFAAMHIKRFALYYLPSYSPELNPDEHVWGYLKKNKLRAHAARSNDELKTLTIKSMRSIQMKPALIKSFFYLLPM